MCNFANNRMTVCKYFILKVWASRGTFIITDTFKSKTELVQLSHYNFVFLGDLWKSICFSTAQEGVGNFKCAFWFCRFCFRRWIETCWSEWAQMATKAEIKCATGDHGFHCGTTKLSFVNSPPTRRQWEAFQLFKPSVLPLCSVCQHGCSWGERLLPWLPGADFSTTQPYLACGTGNQICLSGTLSSSPAFWERSHALPWRPAEHKEAWNQRSHITYFHSRVRRRLNRMIFTVTQLELLQVQWDPRTSILQIRTWNLLT